MADREAVRLWPQQRQVAPPPRGGRFRREDPSRTNGEEEPVEETWRALVEQGERYPGLGLDVHSRRLREAGPFPASRRRTPLVIDTDVGGDPDDAIALAVAARTVPDLALVVTSDERGGDRARFARHLLDALGRSDVPVVAGAQIGEARGYCIEGLFPDSTPRQPADVLGAVARVASLAEGTLRWLGLGPMSNLASVLREQPELQARLHVTQMGGALRYRDPERAEHNVRLDVAAAATVLELTRDPRLVTADVTFTPEMEIGAASPLYRQLAGQEGDRRWADLLRAHLDRWFQRFHPGTMQHDALALSAAMELPFVHFSFTKVSLDEIGRLREDPGGRQVFLSRRADYSAFIRWLAAQLDPVGPAVSPERPLA